MGELFIVIFEGFANIDSSRPSADVHVVDERGRTKQIFYTTANGKPSLSSRIDSAERWIVSQKEFS